MPGTPEFEDASRQYVDHLIGDLPDCLRCKHYSADRVCKAFPGGIPDEIFTHVDGYYHTKPYPGDHGIRFELAEDFKRTTLTTDQMQEITTDTVLGREQQVAGPEADEFRESLREDIMSIRGNGWVVEIPPEWEV